MVLEKRSAVSAIATLAISILLIPIPWLTPTEYQLIASGFQAFGLVVALFFAAMTLSSDLHDRSVDRVLALHAEIVSGEVGAARSRLAHHLRTNGPVTAGHRLVLQPGPDVLRDDPQLSVYADATSGATPREDRVLLLRYFERTNAARELRTVDDGLFHKLIGPHTLWWDAALWCEKHDRPHRNELLDLATWVAQYTAKFNPDYAKHWDRNLSRSGRQPDFKDWPDWA